MSKRTGEKAMAGRFKSVTRNRTLSNWADKTFVAVKKSQAPLRSSRCLHNLTREINKLIFVQHFEEAATLLRHLSIAHPENYEVHFRRVEVSLRTEELEVLKKEYKWRLDLHSANQAFEFAGLLVDLRLLEKHNHDNMPDLLNPSLYFSEGDVAGLSSDAEEQFEKLNWKPLLALNNSKTKILPFGKTINIQRDPQVPDDLMELSMPTLPEEIADEKANIHQIASPGSMPPCVLKAIECSVKHAQNYAAWFIAGCGFEASGKLKDAVEAWKKAARLNPASLSSLATLAELQQMGAVAIEEVDYSDAFESLDKYLVHGAQDTHTQLYEKFLAAGKYKEAIAALRTLADWLQRTVGDVPEEVEILCLLGAMRVYKLQGKLSASDACRRQAEQLIISVKRSPDTFSQLFSVGEMCEQFDLATHAKICFLSVLTSVRAPTELIIQTSTKLIASYISPALKEGLKVAYQNTNGNSEIRFCQLLCALAIKNTDLEKYMIRKNQIRQLYQNADVGQAVSLLQDAFHETLDDPETHLFMGEIYARLGSVDKARIHFRCMYELDFYNFENVIRYATFLLKARDFTMAKDIVKLATAYSFLTQRQVGELSWVKAEANFSENELQEAKLEIEKALQADPWNLSYLVLSLKLIGLPENIKFENESILKEFEDNVMSNRSYLNTGILPQCMDLADDCLKKGFIEFAFNLAKSVFVIDPHSQRAVDLFVKTGAAFNSRVTAQQTLLFFQFKENIAFSFIAAIAARVYCLSGEWALLDEWIDISNKSGNQDKHTRSKLFELEALKLTIEGRDLNKALALIEASLDSHEGEKIPSEKAVLHGYLSMMKGDMKSGLERIEMFLGDEPSIQNLYFYIKGLQRDANKEEKIAKFMSRIALLKPSNGLEQKFMEEIYCVAGNNKMFHTMSLVC